MSEYIKQATDFLTVTETTIAINFTHSKVSDWVQGGRHNVFNVVLANAKGSYSFEFTDSAHNYATQSKRGRVIKPSAYDIMACLSTYDGDFDDFCGDFGYTFSTEKEFIKTKSIFFKVQEETQALRKMFTPEQLDLLADIS